MRASSVLGGAKPPQARQRAPDDTLLCAYGVEEARITSYRDGPLLVRGPFRLEDQDGNPIAALGPGTIALCRCGKSRMRPFCDGSHKIVHFRAPSGAESGRGA